MKDLLSALSKKPSEIVEVAGGRLEVRGLSVGELNKLLQSDRTDQASVAFELVAACCYSGGKKLITDDADKASIRDWAPEYFRTVNDAIARVNGIPQGNSKATGGGVSSSD